MFYFARQRLGPIAEAAGAAPERLGDQTYAALTANDYGQYDGLIGILKPAFGATGLSRLKEQMIESSNTPVQRPPDAEREIVGYGMGGPTYADEIAERSRRMTVQRALKDIADAEGDVDAYVAQL